LETIHAVMLQDNYRAIGLMKEMGFNLEFPGDGTVKAVLNLKEEEKAAQEIMQKGKEGLQAPSEEEEVANE
ncbi:MAG: hypothetical protein QSU88_01175, partial [Candidatus Methanoperedens sp.]|nr:hypothetical protein [Candidatus Methanoperedens sp.]